MKIVERESKSNCKYIYLFDLADCRRLHPTAHDVLLTLPEEGLLVDFVANSYDA